MIKINLRKFYCHCPCGKEIRLKKYHKYYIPDYLPHHGITGKKFKRKTPTWNNNKSKYPDIDLNQIIPCKCGCSENIKLRKEYKYSGIPEYIKGHRPPWNKGLKDVQTSWCKGLTKETDERLQIISEKVSKTLKKYYEKIGGSPQKGKKIEEIYPVDKVNRIKEQCAWSKGLTKEVDSRVKRNSAVKKGKSQSAESNIKRSKTLKGRKKPEVYSIKLSQRSKGNKYGLGKVKSEETCRRISLANTGKKKTEETKKKISIKHMGKIYTKQYKDNMSKIWINKIIQNNGINTSLQNSKKGFFVSTKNQKEIRYESSYELVAYLILEQLSKVKSYDRCRFSIDYTFKDNVHRYIPDIDVVYTDNIREIIEIKPEFMLEDEKVIAKHTAGKEYCNKNNLLFSIWTEKELNLC